MDETISQDIDALLKLTGKLRGYIEATRCNAALLQECCGTAFRQAIIVAGRGGLTVLQELEAEIERLR